MTPNTETNTTNNVVKYSGKKLVQKLKDWCAAEGISQAEMIRRLGWHEQQFYSMDKDSRVVRASTVTKIITTLGIDGQWLLSDASVESDYVRVMKNYPTDILRWLVTEEGKKTMLKQYGLYTMQKAQENLKATVQTVYNA